jgi:hypothetical protein
MRPGALRNGFDDEEEEEDDGRQKVELREDSISLDQVRPYRLQHPSSSLIDIHNLF